MKADIAVEMDEEGYFDNDPDPSDIVDLGSIDHEDVSVVCSECSAEFSFTLGVVGGRIVLTGDDDDDNELALDEVVTAEDEDPEDEDPEDEDPEDEDPEDEGFGPLLS